MRRRSFTYALTRFATLIVASFASCAFAADYVFSGAIGDAYEESSPLTNANALWSEFGANDLALPSVAFQRENKFDVLAVDALGKFDGYFGSGALESSSVFSSNAVVRAQISPPVVSPTSSYSFSEGDAYNAGYNGYNGYAPSYTYEQAESGAMNPPATMEDPTTIKRIFKYQQDCSKTFLYIPRADDGLGVFEGGGGLYFAIPCQTLKGANVNNGIFRLTPSFNLTSFRKPKNRDLGIDLPQYVFDLGVDTSFSVALNDFEGTVAVQVGVASEFEKLTKDTIYVRGRAEGSLPVDDERKVRVLGGVAYYNRIRYKLVPIAGLVWRPNAQNEFRLVFPDPMWGHFLTQVNETEWWFFVRGDIGGGKWLLTDFEHKINDEATYNFDYNDYRVSTGVRFNCPSGIVGSFEVGGSFGREIRTKAGTVYKPKSAVTLGVGLFF